MKIWTRRRRKDSFGSGAAENGDVRREHGEIGANGGKQSSEFNASKSLHHPNIFNDVEINNMYTEHKMTVNQLADIYPLTRLDEKRPASSRGLNEEEAMMRLASGEANLIRPWSTFRYRLRLFGAQFVNTFRLLLLVAACICVLIFVLEPTRSDELFMALILGAALVFMCWLSYLEQRKSVKQIRGFRSMVPLECSAVREGREHRISANQLVRGDLVRIRVGDRLPADVRLIDAQNLHIEASWILGMVEPLEYIPDSAPPGIGVLNARNIAFSGSSCTAGTGLGVVIRVGSKTLIGRLIELIAKEKPARSCLQAEHNRFVRFITGVSLAMATLTFLAGIYLKSFPRITYVFVNGFLIVLVANVPQGLPVTLTAQLLIVARRLYAKCGGMWLKCIDAADALGRTSALMTDKTGVLTTGRLRVTDLWLAGRFHDADRLADGTHGPKSSRTEALGRTSGTGTPRQVAGGTGTEPNRGSGRISEAAEVQIRVTGTDGVEESPVGSLDQDSGPNTAGTNRRLSDEDVQIRITGVDDEEEAPPATNPSEMSTNAVPGKDLEDSADENPARTTGTPAAADLPGRETETTVSEDQSLSPASSWALAEVLDVMSVCSTAYVESGPIPGFDPSGRSNANTVRSAGELDPTQLTMNSLSIWPASRASSFRRRQRRLALRSQSVCSATVTGDSAHDRNAVDRSRIGVGHFAKSAVNLDPQANSALPHTITLPYSSTKTYSNNLSVANMRSASLSNDSYMAGALNAVTRSQGSGTKTSGTSTTVEHRLFHQDLNDTNLSSTFQGRPIDVALLQYAERLSSVERIRQRYEFVHEIPFSSDRRYHLTIVTARRPSTVDANEQDHGDHEDPEEDQLIRYKLTVKGAPEELIRNCATIAVAGDRVEPLTDQHLYEFEEAYAKFADEGKTCLAFASLEFDAFADALFHSPSMGSGGGALADALFSRFPESGWCFLGMAAIWDPPRDRAFDAVQKAERAGVRLILVTGDHPASAEAIARRIGFAEGAPAGRWPCSGSGSPDTQPRTTATADEPIEKRHNSCVSSGYSSANDIDSAKSSSSSSSSTSSESGSSSELAWRDRPVTEGNNLVVVHGDSLSRLSRADIDALLARRRVVFARITPLQKLQLVKHCQRLNYVVTFTGDGLMDSLALKQSDIGITSNSNGSVFAKEAADIVIADNDIDNLIGGVEEARLLYDNLKKTVAYTLSHLLPELLPVLLSFISGFPLGLNSLQVLITDLLTEIPPSVALIFEPPERDIMKRAPRRRGAHLVTPQILFYAYAQAGALISAGCLLAYLTVFWRHGLTLADLSGTSDRYWHVDSPLLRLGLSSGGAGTVDAMALLALNGTTNGVHGVLSAEQQTKIRAQANAAWHITLVVAQIFHSFICATRRTSFFRHGVQNTKLAAAAVFQMIFLCALVFVPGLQDVCGVRPPPAVIWAFPIVLGLVLLAFNEVRKYFIRRYPRNRIVKMFKW